MKTAKRKQKSAIQISRRFEGAKEEAEWNHDLDRSVNESGELAEVVKFLIFLKALVSQRSLLGRGENKFFSPRAASLKIRFRLFESREFMSKEEIIFPSNGISPVSVAPREASRVHLAAPKKQVHSKDHRSIDRDPLNQQVLAREPLSLRVQVGVSDHSRAFDELRSMQIVGGRSWPDLLG